jgi:hypothetical protein
MKQPYEWCEEDLQSLVSEQQPETVSREYKKSDALAKENKSEISKDVSAMANSAGGVIIYGIDEQKKLGGPIRLDEGVDGKQTSREWLEQVIDSNIQPRIDGIVVHPIPIASTGRSAFVVWVPQSSRAPHMAADHRYHKRLGTTTASMEDFEVRDVGRRLESPDLRIEVKFGRLDGYGGLRLEPWIANSSPEPAFYVTCRIYLEKGILHSPYPDTWEWKTLDDAAMLWNGKKKEFEVLHRHWSIPSQHPILEGERYPLGAFCVEAPDWGSNRNDCWYRLGWEIRAPRMAPRVQGTLLTVHRFGGLTPQDHSLRRC